MTSNMPADGGSSILTRPSLLNRLKADDASSWEEFYRIYSKLVRDFAVKAGLTETEAEDVVQETAIAMARHLPDYQYNPRVCRFKTWLLTQATWRIKDQLKKRQRGAGQIDGDDTAQTATVNQVPDPASINLDALFEAEWRKNMFAAALDRVRQKFSLKQIQVFDLLVLKEWPAREVARSLGVSLANVYVIRHRISAAIKKEIKRHNSDFGPPGRK
jgi:RNA polymerase sigma factor (sigma-70 family)